MAIPYVIADLVVFAKIYKFLGTALLFLIVLFLDLDSIALS